MAAPTRNAFLALTGNTGTTAYTPSIATLRTGSLANDCICLFLATDGNPTASLAAQSITDGWELVDQLSDATNACRAVYLRFMVQTDGVAPDPTINLSASEAITGQGVRVRPAAGSTVQFLTATKTSGSSTNPDPPVITNNTGAARDFLFNAFWAGDGVTASTVAPTNYANHQSATISNAANGCAVGSADRTVAALANAGTENPGTFTRATEQWVAFTVGCYQVAVNALMATSIATPAPVVSSATIAQTHALSSAAVATPAPVVASATMGQVHALAAAALATPAPVLAQSAVAVIFATVALALATPAAVLAQATLGQVHALTAQVVATPAPAVTTTAMAQTHVLTAQPVSTAVPVLSAAAMSQVHALEAVALSSPAPQVTTAMVGQRHVLTAQAVEAPVPAVSLAAIAQAHRLTALPLATGTPQVTSEAINQTVPMVAGTITTPAPALDQATIGQLHGLAAQPVETGPPVLTMAGVAQKHVLTAGSIQTAAPVIGMASAAESSPGDPLPVETAVPVITLATAGQAHALASAPVEVPAAELGTATLGQLHVIVTVNLQTGAAALTGAALQQAHQLTAQSVETAAAEVTPALPGAIPDVQVDQPPTVSGGRGALNTESTPRRLWSYSRPRTGLEVAPMPSHRWGAKDPDEVVNYTHNWAALLLDGDEVVGQPEAVVESCDAVVDLSVMKTATVQRVRISGGTPGRCKITIGIHTVQGNYWQEGIVLPIREQ